MQAESLKHIAIAGNIGAGKTTLCIKLAEHFGWICHLESVDKNPYLEDFYHDMKKWAFPLQIFFLHSRFNQIRKIWEGKQTVVQDRTIFEDAYVFAKNLRNSFYMDERDYENYLNVFHSMMPLVKEPDLIIYLRADIPKLVEQIRRRGRPYENNISIQYLENLNQLYEDWVDSYTGELLILDMNSLDYVYRSEDYSYVIQEVERALGVGVRGVGGYEV
ncbi:MAG: deoxynucleoside kinase [Bacteroidota bacterium]